MGKQTSHAHPNKTLYQLQQISLAALLVVAVFAALALIIVAIILAAPLFIMVSVLLLLISAPLLMALVNTPPITIVDEGIILQPYIGAEHHIAWDEIERIETYPLLPQANQEILKQYLIGRKKYREAQGIMLIIPTLPLPYRIAGLLSAEKAMPIIALTNRTHSDYDRLKQRITYYAAHAIQEPLTIEE